MRRMLGHGGQVGLGEDCAEHRSDHLGVRLRDVGQDVADEVDPAALVGRTLEHPRQCGDQALVLVGDHQLHPGQASLAQAGPTSRPRISWRPCSVTPVAITTALDTTIPASERTRLVGRVQVDVGEAGVVQAAGAERAHGLVQARADPRYLGLFRSRCRRAR